MSDWQPVKDFETERARMLREFEATRAEAHASLDAEGDSPAVARAHKLLDVFLDRKIIESEAILERLHGGEALH